MRPRRVRAAPPHHAAGAFHGRGAARLHGQVSRPPRTRHRHRRTDSPAQGSLTSCCSHGPGRPPPPRRTLLRPRPAGTLPPVSGLPRPLSFSFPAPGWVTRVEWAPGWRCAWGPPPVLSRRPEALLLGRVSQGTACLPGQGRCRPVTLLSLPLAHPAPPRRWPSLPLPAAGPARPSWPQLAQDATVVRSRRAGLPWWPLPAGHGATLFCPSAMASCDKGFLSSGRDLSCHGGAASGRLPQQPSGCRGGSCG